MHPTEAINLVEVLLRGLVREAMGDAWTTHASIDMAKLEEKRNAESGKRRGAIVSKDLLDYVEFSQLQRIILDDYGRFGFLGKQKYVEAYFARLDAFRNPAMHSRDLLPFERELVNGIVGELRNLVSIYRSRVDGPDRHYPSIDSVTDSFGNLYTPGGGGIDANWISTGMRLEVGDEVTYTCRGTDPRGRELVWYIGVGAFEPTVVAEGRGSDCQVPFTVLEDYVGEGLNVAIRMKSVGRHHRHNGSNVDAFDDSCKFAYAVNPPPD